MKDRQQPKLSPNDPYALKLRAMAIGLDRFSTFQKKLTLLQACGEDAEIQLLIEEELVGAERDAHANPDPFRATSPVDPCFAGELFLGYTTPYRVPYFMPASQLQSFALIIGGTGGGKSTLLSLMLIQLLVLESLFVHLFDRKYEYSFLTTFQNFSYLLKNDFQGNLLATPPGVDFTLSTAKKAEIISDYLDILVPGRGLLSTVSQSLFNEYVEGTRPFPTPVDVRKSLLNMKIPLLSHHARHRETLISRLDALILYLPESLCSRRKVDWHHFINGNWGINLSGIPTDFQSLFIAVIISDIITYLTSANQRRNGLKHLFVLDEASPLFRRSQDFTNRTPVLIEHVQTGREFGCGFIFASQSIANLSESIVANTATKFLIGRIGSGKDCDVFGSAVGLTRDQKEHLKRILRPGIACVKDPRYPSPFLLEVPNCLS